MAKTVTASANHLFEAGKVIMAASKTPETLLHNMCDVINYMHELLSRPDDEDEGLLGEATTDHVYSALLFIQSFVKPWFRVVDDQPCPKMVEGLHDMLGHAGVDGWREMTDLIQIAISKFMAGGAATTSWNLELMRLYQGFCLATAHLEMHVAVESKMLKAA